MNAKAIVIVGPTASGKSDIAIELARTVGAEIISADSMQIYRHMDIGTAKLQPEQMCGIRHWLLDMIEPKEPFSVAAYQKLARSTMADIVGRGKIPIIVGGTGLYVRAAIDPLEFPILDGTDSIRSRLETRAQNEGLHSLYDELLSRDPAAADIVVPGNKRRIIRALEIIELTGTPFSNVHAGWKRYESLYAVRLFGIDLPRGILYERINKRVDLMLEQGLLDEVNRLLKLGYEQFLTASQAIGYKELIGYSNGDYSLDEAVERIKQRTRNYAKRQLTWFRADPRIVWIAAAELATRGVADLIHESLLNDGFLQRQGETYDL